MSFCSLEIKIDLSLRVVEVRGGESWCKDTFRPALICGKLVHFGQFLPMHSIRKDFAGVMIRAPKENPMSNLPLAVRQNMIQKAKTEIESGSGHPGVVPMGKIQEWALLDIAESLLALQEMLSKRCSRKHL
jgi:hypothetical protein